jgi:hypothetical protein
MVRLSPVSGSPSRWSYRGSDFRIGSRARMPAASPARCKCLCNQTESLHRRRLQRRADFVAKVAEEFGVSRGDDYSNVGAARSCRSLQLERRL